MKEQKAQVISLKLERSCQKNKEKNEMTAIFAFLQYPLNAVRLSILKAITFQSVSGFQQIKDAFHFQGANPSNPFKRVNREELHSKLDHICPYTGV